VREADPVAGKLEIRGEIAEDVPLIRQLIAQAFPTTSEADLVDRLRGDKSAVYSLVAISDRQLVGHVMFSRMERPDNALGLAPVAVLDAFRRQGVAATLIRGGLLRARTDGWASVFVLGDPAYYNRFGFHASLAEGFDSPYAGAHLMALSLNENALAERAGELRYPSAFAALG
jgi:putative acetyltransferase